MARVPERVAPKVALQANVSARAYHAAETLRARTSVLFRSFSQLTETLLFLSLHAYYERPDDAFARSLLHVKIVELARLHNLRAPVETKRVHATVDPEAYRFLNELVAHYPALLANKNEALELIYIYAYDQYEQHPEHFAHRLEDVLRIHGRVAR